MQPANLVQVRLLQSSWWVKHEIEKNFGVRQTIGYPNYSTKNVPFFIT